MSSNDYKVKTINDLEKKLQKHRKRKREQEDYNLIDWTYGIMVISIIVGLIFWLIK